LQIVLLLRKVAMLIVSYVSLVSSNFTSVPNVKVDKKEIIAERNAFHCPGCCSSTYLRTVSRYLKKWTNQMGTQMGKRAISAINFTPPAFIRSLRTAVSINPQRLVFEKTQLTLYNFAVQLCRNVKNDRVLNTA